MQLKKNDEKLKLPEIWLESKELERKTDLLTKPIQDYIHKSGKNLCMPQIGSMFTLFFGLKEVNNFEDTKRLDNQAFAEFFRYMFNEGVYIPPLHNEAWFVSAAHTEEHLKRTTELILKFLTNDCSV